MKSQKGNTLTSLVIYIIVMFMVLGVMSTIINSFYENNDSIAADTEEIVEFNNFNVYFLEEIKKNGNNLDSIQDNYILFTSGNSFSMYNKKIYYNDIEICNGVKEFKVQQGENGDNLDKTIVYVTISFENFSKSINYKIEEIY